MAVLPFDDGPLPGAIRGEDAQIVEFSLQRGDRLTCEANALLYLLGEAAISIDWGRGLLTPLWRKYAGEELFLSDLVASGPAVVGLSPPQWGRIVRIPLRRGGVVFTARGAYMAHTGELETTIGMARRLRANLFGSQQVVFQRHEGDGDLFIHAYGAVVDMTLAAGQVLRVSPGNLLAFEGSVGLDAQVSAGLMTMVFGKQEAILDQLMGPGRVWLQSLDIAPKLARPPRGAMTPPPSPTPAGA